MKKLLLILFLLPILLIGQSNKLRNQVYVKTRGYEVVYSEVKLQPLWVRYTVKCINGKFSRKGLDFYTNDTIKTSTNADYINNEYDKGHMAPAAAFNCDKELLKETFSYLNCALQNQSLNRGVWRLLETTEREWAMTDSVVVTIKVKFAQKPNTLPSGAAIPLGFYKTVYLIKSKKKYKYYFPNVTPKSQIVSHYEIK